MADGIGETGEHIFSHRDRLSPERLDALAAMALEAVSRYEDDRVTIYLDNLGLLEHIPADAVIEQMKDALERGGVCDAVERAEIATAVAAERNKRPWPADPDANLEEVRKLVNYAAAELNTDHNVALASATH